MLNLLKRLLCPFRVDIESPDVVNGFATTITRFTHLAWDRQDALSWAACYPVTDLVIVTNRRSNRIVAWRRG